MTRVPLGTTSRDVAIAVANRTKARMADPRMIWGIPWPFDGLNKLTGGIHKTEMTILTARPSVGKTQVLVTAADSVATYLTTRQGKAEFPDGEVKVVLCESTKEVFLQRWACIRSGVSSKKVMSGRLRDYPEQADRFFEELKYISELPIRYLDEPRSIDHITDFLASGNTVWWGLDHIQVCPFMPGRANDNSVSVLTPITTQLANAAKSIAPGMVLAHTPREVDKREDRRPRLGDIKGSSSVEGAARVVLGLYTDRIYQKVAPEAAREKYIVELQLLKNNNGGGVGQTVPLLFDPVTGIFTDMSEFTDEED